MQSICYSSLEAHFGRFKNFEIFLQKFFSVLMFSYKSHNRIFVDGKLVYGDSIFLNNGDSFLSLKESMCGAVVTKRHL